MVDYTLYELADGRGWVHDFDPEQAAVHSVIPLATAHATVSFEPFPLQDEYFPPVIISYATATDAGNGERYAWALANLLRKNKINAYLGKMNETGGDWEQK